MSYPKYIDRYHRVDLYERKENAQFSAIFGGVRQLKWRFQTFLDFEKTRAFQDLWMVFSKTTHYNGYLGKIWRNRKFRDCHLILGIHTNWLLSTWKSILDCSRHFSEFVGEKREKRSRGKKTLLSTRTKLNKFGREVYLLVDSPTGTPVVSLQSQQPVENHLQHRSGSETDGPGVVQWFPVNDSIGIPRNGTESRGDCLCSFTRRLRAMQTCKLRFVGGIVLFFWHFFFKLYTLQLFLVDDDSFNLPMKLECTRK